MPYEKLLDDVMETLRPSREVHRSAVVASVDEIRGILASHGDTDDGRGRRLSRELGPFASARVDGGALAAVLSVEERTLAPGALEVLERSLDVLAAAAEGLEEHTVLRVPTGGDLRDVVRDALTATGVVFGAARAAELARAGAYRPDEHNALFSGKPFHRWTAAERGVAPPLVVIVDGADLRPAGLADFLDGALKVVLLVQGDAPPAALARVVTPGLAVVQTRDAGELDTVVETPGPALAAVFEPDAEGPVAFVHDPAAGELPWERLRVEDDLEELRERAATIRRKDRSAAEDLAHLVALAFRPAGGGGPDAGGIPGEGPAAEDDADAGVDRLAAWLLASTEL